MRYTLLQNVPGITIGFGSVVESSNYPWVDFSNQFYFEPYKEPFVCNYKRYENVLFDEKLYQIKYINLDTKHMTMYQVGNNRKSIILPIESPQIKKLTLFYFVNSEGDINSDYLERKKLRLAGVEYKKEHGNYFETKEEAKLALDCKKYPSKKNYTTDEVAVLLKKCWLAAIQKTSDPLNFPGFGLYMDNILTKL